MLNRWQRRAIHRRQEEREREQHAEDMAWAAQALSQTLGICPNSPTDEHLWHNDICDLCGLERQEVGAR